MRGKDGFQAMRQFEKRIRPLTDQGWHVEKLNYEDEEGEPFRAYLIARLDVSRDEDGKL